MITLCIISIAEYSPEKTIESFSGIGDCCIEFLDDRDFNRKISTEWKMFMFADECLSTGLNAAIPDFLKFYGDVDIWKIYKRKNEGISICPRLFKGHIELKKDCLMPTLSSYKMDTILDGFIL